MTKLYAQRKDVFDINKVTVIGSPTITSDGVASGISSSNYITGTSIDYSSLNSYAFHIKINSGDTPSNNSMFWGIQRVLYLYQNTIGKIAFIDTTSGASLSFVADRNTDYDIICGHDENNLYYLKYRKIEEENYTVLSGTVNKRTTANGVLNIGCYSGGGYPLLTGSIDLGSIKVYANNQLVFSPTKPTYYLERRKEGFDLSKFTVVGSPTITEDGVASGFNGSNYLKTGVTIGQNPFKIICKCSTPNSGTGVLVDNISGNSWYPLLLQANNTIAVYAKDVNGNSVYTGGSITIPYNQQFLVSFEFIGNKYILGLSLDDGITWTYKESENSNYIANIDKELIIGRYGTFAQNGWLGSIDLTAFKIYVDGKEVFTGAKEKFYAMRGGK